MLYEVITNSWPILPIRTWSIPDGAWSPGWSSGKPPEKPAGIPKESRVGFELFDTQEFVITSYSIHYTKLYDTTSFARADENAAGIRKNAKQMQPTENLFFTYGDQYVYFGHLYPLQQRAEDVRVFRIQEGHLHEVIIADHALYGGEYWHISDARMLRKPKVPQAGGAGIEIVEHQNRITSYNVCYTKLLRYCIPLENRFCQLHFRTVDGCKQ